MGQPDVEKFKERVAGLMDEVDRIIEDADGWPAVSANAGRIRASLNMIRIALGGSVCAPASEFLPDGAVED